MTTDPRVLEKAAELLRQKQRARDMTRLERFAAKPWNPSRPNDGGVYEWQQDFMSAGSTYQFRCLMAANRSGKTMVSSCEVAMHLTGWYPDWWYGKRFDRPVRVCCGSESNQASRDITQYALLGDPSDHGTGWIPARAFHPDGPATLNCGITNVYESLKVKHATGGWSTVFFKSYEQKREKWQGTSFDVMWLDEEPPDAIYGEAATRIMDRRGILILSFTPLKGMGNVIKSFRKEGARAEGRYLKNVTWDDAPHLTEEDKRSLLAAYPEHERDARSKGIPMMGEGAVYPISEDRIVCDPFKIPDHFRRICGIDFGLDHPFASVWIAYDPDADIIYATDTYRQSGEIPAVHSGAIKSRGEWIPVAWPHDGHKRDFGSGEQLSEQYLAHGLDMLPMSARYEDDKGGGQGREPIIAQIYERMRTGRFKVFRNQRLLLEEIRLYHRKDGKIVAEDDDLVSALHYACMMLRYAVTQSETRKFGSPTGQSQNYEPLSSMLG